jgi:hypothetical protein
MDCTDLDIGCRGHELTRHRISNDIFGRDEPVEGPASQGKTLAAQRVEEHGKSR